jgi:hypothetical protein
MDSVAERKIHVPVSNMEEIKAGLHGCGPVREEEYLRNKGGGVCGYHNKQQNKVGRYCIGA